LSRAKIFTKLDIRDTYYRLRIGGVVSRSLAKRLLYSYFKYTIRSFRLINAPVTF
ncbi:uncharacterized protein SEPMUDRAFT_42998, partial [Sphaerulina musiva SO2202]